MRLVSALTGVAAFAFSTAAFAAPVSIAPVSFSPELQAEIENEYGAREGEYLQRAVNDAVSRALINRGATVGADGLVLEITLIDADPNRPTLQQSFDTPGLDSIRSISIGGAQLHGVLRGSDGQVIGEVSHQRYNSDLQDLSGAENTWSEARLAIRQFARKVADAYAASGQ